MKKFLNAFKPNYVVSKEVLMIYGVFYAIFFGFIWSMIGIKIIPNPIEIGKAFYTLVVAGEFLHELYVSLWLNIKAMIFSTLVSLLFAYATIFDGFKPIAKFISKMRFMGLAGWTLVFTMYTSSDTSLKVALLTFGMSVFLVTSFVDIVAAISSEDYDYARTLKLSEWEVFYQVVIRGRMAQMLEAVRQNAAIGWMMLTMVEGLSKGQGGIGVLILNSNKFFNLDVLFAVQFFIMFIGLFQDYIITLMRKLACPYYELELVRR